MTLELDDIPFDGLDACLGLMEQRLQSGIDTLLPNGGWRRFQTLIVMKYEWDVPRAFRDDMGPAEDFEAGDISVFGGTIELKDGTEIPILSAKMPPFESIYKIRPEYTVERIKYEADQLRDDPNPSEPEEPMDIWDEFFTQREQQDQYKKEHTRTLGTIVDDILWKQREGII